MNGARPDLSLAIIHYNTPELLAACLQSVERHARPLFRRVLLIDSASDRGDLGPVRARFPWVETIALPDNRGFGRAANYALRRLAEDDVLLLNADTELRPDAVEILADHLRAHPEVGIAGPRQIDGAGAWRPSCGGRPNLAEEWARRRQHRSPARETALVPGPVCWVSGSALWIRRATLRAAGLFDERFFLYFEDIDLCLRAGRAGFAVHYLPAATVIHHGGASAATTPARAEFEYRRSQLRFWQKHGGCATRAAVRLWIALRYSWRLFAARRDSGDADQARRVLRLVWRNDS
ncbi:MAG: glycosyltransferase family 2 protein [Myxococcales bacterium]|nr:glycosyltransferase family 2 protein [Myxococcales bacterium]